MRSLGKLSLGVILILTLYTTPTNSSESARAITSFGPISGVSQNAVDCFLGLPYGAMFFTLYVPRKLRSLTVIMFIDQPSRR